MPALSLVPLYSSRSRFPSASRPRLPTRVSGKGRATPEFWSVFRKLYLDHPHIMEIVASVQAGAGSVAVAAAVKNWSKPRGKILAGIGGALILDAGTRIFTTLWVQAALEYEGLRPRNPLSADTAE